MLRHVLPYGHVAKPSKAPASVSLIWPWSFSIHVPLYGFMLHSYNVCSIVDPFWNLCSVFAFDIFVSLHILNYSPHTPNTPPTGACGGGIFGVSGEYLKMSRLRTATTNMFIVATTIIMPRKSMPNKHQEGVHKSNNRSESQCSMRGLQFGKPFVSKLCPAGLFVFGKKCSWIL